MKLSPVDQYQETVENMETLRGNRWGIEAVTFGSWALFSQPTVS